MILDFISPFVLIPTSSDTLVQIRSDLFSSEMDPLMVLEVGLVGGLVRAVPAVVNLPASLLVLVTEALSGQPHEPITNPDCGGDMDFVHVTILRTFRIESLKLNNCEMNYVLSILFHIIICD